MTIEGDQLHYDLTGSHAVVGAFLNSCYGTTFSSVIAGTKTFFPDVPLNSGFYRAVSVELESPERWSTPSGRSPSRVLLGSRPQGRS